MSGKKEKHIIVGISGASGVEYGISMLRALKDTDITTHLVISKHAGQVISLETDYDIPYINALADIVHSSSDMSASISSGSFQTIGMIVAPCSVRTVSEIASGVTSTLISRAADVTLKERRRLVLMVRETPLHSGHLENMLKLSNMGAIIAPPVPAFYNMPKTIDDIVQHSVGRVLDLFGIDVGTVRRWE